MSDKIRRPEQFSNLPVQLQFRIFKEKVINNGAAKDKKIIIKRM